MPHLPRNFLHNHSVLSRSREMCWILFYNVNPQNFTSSRNSKAFRKAQVLKSMIKFPVNSKNVADALHLILTTATHRNRIRSCIQWYVKSALQSSSGCPFIIKEKLLLIFFLDWSPELLLILSCIKWHWKRLMYILPTSAHHSNPIHHRSLSFRVCCRLSNFLSFR